MEFRAYGIPKPDNSFAFADDTDPRGRLGSIEKANIDQPSPVFFLGGRFVDSRPLANVRFYRLLFPVPCSLFPVPDFCKKSSEDVNEDPFTFTRSVVVPDGTVLVTPLINAIGPDGFVEPPPERRTEQEIREEITSLLNDPILFFALRGITEVAKIDFSPITGNATDMILLPNVDDSLISSADFIF